MLKTLRRIELKEMKMFPMIVDCNKVANREGRNFNSLQLLTNFFLQSQFQYPLRKRWAIQNVGTVEWEKRNEAATGQETDSDEESGPTFPPKIPLLSHWILTVLSESSVFERLNSTWRALREKSRVLIPWQNLSNDSLFFFSTLFRGGARCDLRDKGSCRQGLIKLNGGWIYFDKKGWHVHEWTAALSKDAKRETGSIY